MTLCTLIHSLETRRQSHFYDFGRIMILNEKHSGGIFKNYSQEIDSANADFFRLLSILHGLIDWCNQILISKF